MSIDVFSLWENRENLRIFLKNHPFLAPFLFIFLQISQVVIGPIPGEAVCFIGGFVFGAFKGFILNTVGILIGSTISFSIARFFKKKLFKNLENSQKYLKVKNVFKKHGLTGAFIFYLFPGFPKDLLNYFLGFMPLSFKMFIFICSLGRAPGIFALSLQGDTIYGGHPKNIFIVYFLCGMVLGIYFLFKKKNRKLVK